MLVSVNAQEWGSLEKQGLGLTVQISRHPDDRGMRPNVGVTMGPVQDVALPTSVTSAMSVST